MPRCSWRLRLGEEEFESLRTMSSQTRRTQSDLIREGIFLLARSPAPLSSPAQAPSTELTTLEEWFVILSSTGYLLPRIARDLGISVENAHQLRRIVRGKIRAILARTGPNAGNDPSD